MRGMDTDFSKQSFSAFAKQLAALSRVEKAIADLSQHQAININLILYALWCGLNQHGRLSKQNFKTLIASTQPWHERIYNALQRLVKQLASHQTATAKRLQSLIDIEYQQAEQIERTFIADTLLKLNHRKRNSAQQLSDACYNIANYYHVLRMTINAAEQAAIENLLNSSFTGLTQQDISNSCSTALQQSTSTSDEAFTQLQLEEI